MGTNGDSQINEAQQNLLKKRASFIASEREKYKQEMAEISVLISSNRQAEAREIAFKLKDSPLYQEVVEMFKLHPITFTCEKCLSPINSEHFLESSLSWANSKLCEECQNKEQEEEKNRTARSFANFADRNMKAILRVIGVEGQLMSASYDGFSDDVKEACKRSRMGKHGLYIHGGVGRGKSWLAVALLKDTIKTLYQKDNVVNASIIKNIEQFKQYYRFVYVPWLLMEIKSSYDYRDARSEKEIIEEYTNMPILVLDDIGAERPTEWVREKLNTIIYFRNNRGLKTVYTSNVAPEGLQERLDERITSRILQQCDSIHLTGPDRRRQ